MGEPFKPAIRMSKNAPCVTSLLDRGCQCDRDCDGVKRQAALEDVYRSSQELSRSIAERGFTGETWAAVDRWRSALRRVAPPTQSGEERE